MVLSSLFEGCFFVVAFYSFFFMAFFLVFGFFGNSNWDCCLLLLWVLLPWVNPYG